MAPATAAKTMSRTIATGADSPWPAPKQEHSTEIPRKAAEVSAARKTALRRERAKAACLLHQRQSSEAPQIISSGGSVSAKGFTSASGAIWKRTMDEANETGSATFITPA